ncbi:hypothetical protein KAFR_0J00760 [Kazachstania africana CBS 2517]|uniref:EF-hand domain-containing protein n=1 Tax=Kazachstania africana (strain ATCC 22294 / BCRC 22015 / CBS 2517 / CECT 1963 / NBRC 1671 / NRRL Y-8276) TaxID=1071382 RepID=H2B0J4_KAZAF|nr:hypothetical protein KAFR_0J00760 [Kazachstania africana CBS 2517]CCF60144.1 hypothetical protein KAFR_0J00760 [Kazachstania africana CBS 2517]
MVRDDDDTDKYRRLFDKIDSRHLGKFTYLDLKEYLKDVDHPISTNDIAIYHLFQNMDLDNDHSIDLKDFIKYNQSAESQIKSGFQNIDLDDDGSISSNEILSYLSKKIDGNKDQDRKLKKFLQWAFNKNEKITYDQWHNFLVLMPRGNGNTRLTTAFNYYHSFNNNIDDLEVTSEGDVTLINDFVEKFKYFIIGGISGVVSRTCTAPFDRIKTFLIVRTDLKPTLLNEQKRKEISLERHVSNVKKIRSPLVKAITSLYRTNGLKAFYVGNGLNSVKVFPESSIKFGTFEITKKLLRKWNPETGEFELSKISTYIAGGLAGVMSQFVVYPVDTIKFRLQCTSLGNYSQTSHNQILVETVKSLYKEGGISIFYRGLITGLLGIFPYAAMDLGTFTMLKNIILKQSGGKENELTNLQTLSIGATSGSIGTTIVYPINLLRTRLQTQGTFAHPYKYKGFRDVMWKTIQREGYQGLYKGLIPTLAKVCPSVSISYLCYENLKRLTKLDKP